MNTSPLSRKQKLRRWFSALPAWRKFTLLFIEVPLSLAGSFFLVVFVLFIIACIQWNGEELRQQEQLIYTGLDYRHPEGGVLYRVVGADGQHHYYARLPEIRYRILPDLITFDMYGRKNYKVCDVERSGREGIGELEVSHKLYTPNPQYGGYDVTDSPTPTELEGCQREVDALPEGVESIPAPLRTRPYGLLNARAKTPTLRPSE